MFKALLYLLKRLQQIPKLYTVEQTVTYQTICNECLVTWGIKPIRINTTQCLSHSYTSVSMVQFRSPPQCFHDALIGV
ncbi:hypothetical protein E2C01_067972 [Portunus trituberculatus]|uniref:Uncharacterized protein n=1 Tax=Portunus trituberculatus TaxID=210409 RepID=A0A5B7HVB1_PORTR|nr:hypothetical protein [Portunus trituberculatus]